MKAYLALHPGKEKESEPTGLYPEMRRLNALAAKLGLRYLFDRAHILGKQLHGHGKKKNLMFTSANFNQNIMLKTYETPVAKRIYEQGEVVYYVVKPHRNRKLPPKASNNNNLKILERVPDEIEFEAKVVTVKTNKKGKIKGSFGKHTELETLFSNTPATSEQIAPGLTDRMNKLK